MPKSIPFTPGDQVAAYFRDSGGDKQELSVPRQEAEFRRWCQENGLIPGSIFKDEARPGSSVVSRSQFQAMMHYFRSGELPETGLVIWNYQRFAREIDDSQFFRADIRRRGYTFYSLNDDVPEGPMGRVYEALLDWKNEQFLLDLSSDVKSGLRSLVERYGAVPGTPPRGFMRTPLQISTHRDGRPRIVHRWEPDPDQATIVRLAYQMLLAGHSLAEIQKATHLYGSVNSFQSFFANQIYKGALVFGDLVIEGYCEPIVDPTVWDQAQIILAKRARRQHMSGDNPNHPRRNGQVYILSGLAYCARCGSPLSGLSVKQAAGWRYERYACSRQKRNHDCDAETIPRLFLENMALRSIRETILTAENLAARQMILRHTEAERLAELDQARNDLKARLAGVRRRIANVTEALAEEGKSRALLGKLANLESEEADLIASLADNERQSAAVFEPLTDAQINEQIARFQQLLDSDDPLVIRRVLRGLLSRLTIERDGDIIYLQVQYFYPPDEHPPPDDENISKAPAALGAQSQTTGKQPVVFIC